jgi:catechol 2,3-dioxygenase-like lactoylglutathione lyase family enzyme
MIKHIKHTTVWVRDQNEALRFYTEKLGFEIRADQTFGDFRWLTVGLKDQPELEVGLSPLAAGQMLNAEEARMMMALQDAGKLGGILLHTDDIQQTYEAMSAKGVTFRQPPSQQHYGMMEAIFLDDSGNWFSLMQPV